MEKRQGIADNNRDFDLINTINVNGINEREVSLLLMHAPRVKERHISFKKNSFEDKTSI